MARTFICYKGDIICADGKDLIKVSGVLDIPFHVTVIPFGENPRRFDSNENKAIPVTKDQVMLKVGEPLIIDPDYSVMVTRVINNETCYCKISVRSPQHIDVRKKYDKT